MLEEFMHGKEKYNELILMLGKKSGKDYMAAVILCYKVYKLLLIDNPQKYFDILEGQPLYGVNVASEKGQARDIFLAYFRAMVKSSTFLSMFLEDSLSHPMIADEVRFCHNIRVTCKPCTSQTVLGLTVFCNVMDEIDHYKNKDKKPMGWEVYNNMKPNLLPFGDFGCTIVISSPAGQWVISELCERAKKNPLMLAYNLPTWEVNPRHTRASLQSFFDADPIKAELDFGARPLANIGTAFHPDKIDAMVALSPLNINKMERDTSQEKVRIVTLDPALKHDGFALSMGYRDEKDGLFKIDYFHEWQGTRDSPVRISDVEDHIRLLYKNFNVVLFALDQHQSASTIQRLGDEDIPMRETNFTKNYNTEIYTCLVESINLGKVKMCSYFNPNVQSRTPVNELKNLLRIAKSGYVVYEAPTTGQVTTDDFVDCVANLLFLLNQIMYDPLIQSTNDCAIDEWESTTFKEKEDEVFQDDFAIM